jgi:hypothetical protein
MHESKEVTMARGRKKTTKGAFYRKDKVKRILGRGRRGLRSRKNCWAVDIERLLLAAVHLAARGKKEMHIFITEDVPGRSAGKVVDPSSHMLFIETVDRGVEGCMEEFPPVIYP